VISQGRWPLVRSDQMRELDRHTIDVLGVPGEILMESAGRAVAEVALAEWSRIAATSTSARACIVCGAGNNAGDGFVVGRQLHAVGVPVELALLGDPSKLAGDAAANYQRARAFGIPIASGAPRIPREGVVVDAIFGTGLSRAVEGPSADAIEQINAARRDALRARSGSSEPSRLRVVAVDLPSGLDADRGQVLGVAVEADITVAISLPKLGLALEPGRALAGQIVVARIGIVDAAPSVDLECELWAPAAAARALPARPVAGHKGSFGHVLVVAGSEGKTGAAALAARAAGRAGAGLVTVACPAGLNDILEVKCTEAMTVPVADTASRSLASEAEDAIVGLASERDVVALGPGLGREDETASLVRSLVKRLEVPLVIDADGLFALVPAALKGRRSATILTPHPGEAARLLGVDPKAINADRVAMAQRLAKESQSVSVLKGAATIVAEPGGRTFVNPTGGPALATGGTGDVLTGLIAGLLAQGAGPFEAAAAGVYLHGLAGDRLAALHGPSGLMAEDLADALPAAGDWLRDRAEQGRHQGSHEFAGEPSYSLALPFPGA